MSLAKKLGIAAGSLFGVSAVGILGLYVAFLHAPSPEAQCKHVTELAEKDLANKGVGAKLGPDFQEDCLRRAKKSEYEGQINYAKRSNCIVDSTTLDEASKCGKEGRKLR